MIHAAEALHKVQSVAMGMSLPVDPVLVIEPDGVHYERVSFIFADRVAHPSARISVGMSSAIHVDSAHPVILIEQEEHLIRELPELEKPPVVQQ